MCFLHIILIADEVQNELSHNSCNLQLHYTIVSVVKEVFEMHLSPKARAKYDVHFASLKYCFLAGQKRQGTNLITMFFP